MNNLCLALIDPRDVTYDHVASEIVRAMTNEHLSNKQKRVLKDVAKLVIYNHLNNKTPKAQIEVVVKQMESDDE